MVATVLLGAVELAGVVLALETSALAPSADLIEVAALLGADAQEWVLTSGEEHAMLATLTAGAPLPAGFRVVGGVRAAEDGWHGVTVDGARRTDAGGWVHYPR